MLPTKETFRAAEIARSGGQEYKVLHIYPKKGTNIFPKRRLCEVESKSGEKVIIKAKHSGIVTQVLIKVDDTIEDGCDILELEACTHTALMGNICCDCGVCLDEKDIPKTEAVSMLHSVPDLKVARNEARKLGQEDINNLLKQRKLVLLVDLDQTLIHTTNDNIPADLKDVCHFQINYGGPWYHARLRPHTKTFLEKISKYYELHISTFGVREYAHHIAHFLDPDRKLFGQRILSRNECLDMMSKKANLDSLFPCGDNLVCIIDDRTDVWNYSPNVVQVVPYHFFRHTGDINAPQGLQKKENDDREGIDFIKLKNENIKTVEFPTEDDAQALEGVDEDKNYSSDSDSDKDSKEMLTEASDNNSVNSNQDKIDAVINHDIKETNGNDEKVNKLSDNNCTKEENSSESTLLPDSLAESNLSDDRVGDDANTKTDHIDPKPNSEMENTDNEEVKSKEVDKRNKKITEKDAVTKKELSRKEAEVEGSKRTYGKNSSRSKRSDDNVFDVSDSDDYLLYLEDILIKIHKRFFMEYDASQEQCNSNEDNPLPDLKVIVPSVRREVLKGVNIVFSGVVPQQTKLQESKAYFIATSFGANVTEKIILKDKSDTEDEKNMYTTHMVAANRRTEKVTSARKHKSLLKIVTPNWLWKCAERWELVEEKLFPLSKETEKEIHRLPPHHCFFPDPSWLKHNSLTEQTNPGPSGRTRTASGTLLQDVNPLMFFSPDEKNNMADEVEQILSDEDDGFHSLELLEKRPMPEVSTLMGSYSCFGRTSSELILP
nr:RNA polymerase II subunit A C-terminal domain phosphatase-like isoform X2 [Procambarus clarkii]